MRREPAAASRDQIDDFRRAVHRLERADPEHEDVRAALERPEQGNERDGRLQVAAVGSEMDTCQGNLAEARRGDASDFANHVWQGKAPAGPARRWNDAIRTALLAARLHSERERGTPGHTRLDRQTAGTLSVG